MDTSLASGSTADHGNTSPIAFLYVAITAVLQRSDVRHFDKPASTEILNDTPAKTRRVVCRCQSAGHQNPVMVGAIPSDSTSAFVAVYLNPGSSSPVRKNKLPHAVSLAASR